MILINKNFNIAIKRAFSEIVTTVNHNIVFKKNSAITQEERNFCLMLNKKTIRKLVFSHPKNLKKLIIKIHNNNPLVCERFSPDYFFKDFNLTQNIINTINLPLKSQANKARVRSSILLVLEEITRFLNIKPSLILNDISNTPYTPNSMTSIRDKIKALIALKSGGKVSDKVAATFPSWVNAIPDIFNYSLIDRRKAYDLNEFLDISICPYCNSEEIECIRDANGTDYRPAFDHFIPKFKYPLVSFSLYNLIPSCDKCNSTYKKTLDPVMAIFSNPFLSGVSNHRLFDFTYDIDYIFGDGIIHNDGISIQLINQNNDLDINMVKFDIMQRYNSGNCKRMARAIAKKSFDLKAYETNFDIYPTLLGMYEYEETLEPLKHQHKKFRQDAILTFANKKVPL